MIIYIIYLSCTMYTILGLSFYVMYFGTIFSPKNYTAPLPFVQEILHICQKQPNIFLAVVASMSHPSSLTYISPVEAPPWYIFCPQPEL